MRLHINGTQTSALLSIFFIPHLRSIRRPRFAFALRAAILTLVLAAPGAACGTPEGPWTPRPYYDIYDEAVNLYYKPPRRPEQALTLMERACRENKDGQDILCYNLGVLLELQAAPRRRILAAYKRAGEIRPHALYSAAIQRMQPDPDAYASPYLQSVARMTVACRENRPDRALSEFRRAIQAAAENQTSPAESGKAPPSRPELSAPPPPAASAPTVPLPRESFAQPFFAECLAGEAQRSEYEQLLNRLIPGGAGGLNLEAQVIRARARLDPFHTLWDVELNLRGLRDGRDSKNPATAEWHDFVQTARRGQGAAAALHLRAFFDGLDALAADVARNGNSGPGQSKAEIRRRVRAFKRAAAVLIQNDPYFHRVRGVAAVQQLVRPIVK